MNADIYLNQEIQKYNPRNLTNYAYLISHLHSNLKTWAGSCYLEIVNSGSNAKGTAISLASDVDYLVSLKMDCNQNAGGLKSIYDSLYSHLKNSYHAARKQNVSVRIDIPLGLIFPDALEVDITPAKKQNNYSTDHSLWVSKSNTWTKTNIQKHILDIVTSGRREEIKLLKIWRELNQLDFPSIYLEYLLITDILIKRPFGANYLTENFWHILSALAKDVGNPLFSRILDPANSNNIFSDLLSKFEKDKIIVKAKNAVMQKNWSTIVW